MHHPNLDKINIPNNVYFIGQSAFAGCENLKEINISGNKINEIYECTFSGCGQLRNVTIGKGVKKIGPSAFLNCKNLKNIIIPDTVNEISSYAFGGCVYIENIYFTGTEEQWNSIEVNSYNECLYDANIHFNYSTTETTTYQSKFNSVQSLSTMSVSEKIVASTDKAISGNEYVLLSLKQTEGEINLSSDNLLYIGQQTATSSEITFDFIPKSEDFGMVVIVGIFADGTKIENAEVDSKEEPELFVAKWIVDGAESAQIYEIGEAIVKPSNPAKDGYKFVGWTPAVPETMPAYDLTFTAVFEKSYICPDCGNEILREDAINEHIVAENAAKIKPTIKVKNNNGAKTINYGETLRLINS